jgi:hypothetical protein
LRMLPGCHTLTSFRPAKETDASSGSTGSLINRRLDVIVNSDASNPSPDNQD